MHNASFPDISDYFNISDGLTQMTAMTMKKESTLATNGSWMWCKNWASISSQNVQPRNSFFFKHADETSEEDLQKLIGSDLVGCAYYCI